MKKGVIERTIVIAIIMLFIGTSIIPSQSKTITDNATNTASIQLIINNDGSGDPTDKNIDVPSYIPTSGITPILTINFTITGVNNSEPTAFYGDDAWEDWKNITITGDILYPVNDITLYHVGTKGDWNCYITPTKPGGIISLNINWPGNGSANNSIQIVNGTYVRPQVDSFPWGGDFNLTVVVQDMEGAAVKNAHVYLIWEDVALEFNSTVGDNKPGNGLNGEYTFWITKEDQGATAPRYITISAQWYNGFWGHTKVNMKQPIPPPELTFNIVGGFGIYASIKNNGMTNLSGILWQIHVEGGIFGQVNKTVNGTINIAANWTKTVKTGIFIGLGPISITVKVSDEEQTAIGFQFIIFSILQE